MQHKWYDMYTFIFLYILRAVTCSITFQLNNIYLLHFLKINLNNLSYYTISRSLFSAKYNNIQKIIRSIFFELVNFQLLSDMIISNNI